MASKKLDYVAVIFAAGLGRRLKGVVREGPKALLPVGNTTLIERQVALLHEAGITDIVVIVGYMSNSIKKVLGSKAKYAHNPLYRTTQTLYSMWCARDYVAHRPMIMIMGDMLFDKRLLRRLLDDKCGTCFLMDGGAALDEESTKVQLNRHGKVYKVDKPIPLNDAVGEYLGLNKFSAAATDALIEWCGKKVKTYPDWRKAHVPPNEFIREQNIKALDARGTLWTEIDFKKDYLSACSIYRKLQRGKNEKKTNH